MSQEERSELTELVSDLSGEESESSELNTEDSKDYDWDNYRENPSFIEIDPEEEDLVVEQDLTVPRSGIRASSTDNNFLEDPVPPVLKPFIFSLEDNQYAVWPPRNPSSESDFAPEENLLPRGLLESIEEVEEDVFFDSNLETQAEKMPPKAPPTIDQLFANFTEKVEEFDSMKSCVDALGEPPDTETLREMDELNKAIRKLAIDMKRTKPAFASDYPHVGAEKDRIFISLIKLRKAKESEVHTAADLNTKEEEIDSTVSSLVTEFGIWEEEVKGVDEKMMKLFEDKPTPSSFEVEEMKKFLEDLRTAEKTAKPLYIKLAVEISKYIEDQKKKEKTEEAKKIYEQPPG